MAAKPIDADVIAAIISDWRITKLSQDDLAAKYRVSKGFVNRICKGVQRDCQAIVTAGVEYKQALASHDDRMMTAIMTEVDERTKHIQFFNSAALRNVQTAVNKITEETTQAEHRMLAETILKGRETVLGKSPDTAIQINNGNQPITEIRRTIIDPRHTNGEGISSAD